MNDFRSMQDMFNGTVNAPVNRQPTPLFLADALNADARSPEIKLQAASELRRLYAENQGQAERIQDIYNQLNNTEKEVDDLRAELHEQAKINGAGAERELKLMTDMENKQAELLRIKAHAEMQRMDDEALLRQALEALEAKGDAWVVLERKAIAAIKERLK